ncbi:MAG: NUDIX domain-containing protein [Alphaproteobacteria bacterium]|nr:NUDIX domain-containing protein [Alphaproteobacteria bacterium]
MSELKQPVAAVGIICVRKDEVLLIRRGKAPREGEWSLPGGRIEWGEGVRDAALRELKEETGVEAAIVGLIDVVDGVFASRTHGEIWGHYVLVDFAARWVNGEPRAGDDAAEARFIPISEIDSLAMWSETVRVIRAAQAMIAAA